jgi:hypothetical protein
MDAKRDNFLKQQPVRVVWIGAPLGTAPSANSSVSAHTFCFIGNENIPRHVRDAILRLSATARCDTRELHDYFDGDPCAILGINLAREVAQIVGECVTARTPVGGAIPDSARDDEDDAELKAIEEMLSSREPAQEDTTTRAHIERAPQFARDGWTVVPDVQMFPEDSITDVKRKIFVQTHIPIYRQHVVAVRARDKKAVDAGSMSVSYNVSTVGAHSIDFRELYCATNEIALFGIPVDRAIYDARDDIRIEARDHITTIEQTRPDFFIVLDLANWIAPNIEQVRGALSDNYQFELLYYGFIAKYFPLLTRECFHSYISNEGEMVDRFPDLAPVWSTVRNSVALQCRISAASYTQVGAQKDIDHLIMRASVTSLAPGIPLIPINLRDFFDSIVCSKTIVDARAIADTTSSRHSRGAYRYELRKFFKNSELMSARTHPSATARAPSLGGEPGVVITYALGDMLMFLIVRATGRVLFQFQWREEDEIDFATMLALFHKYSARLVSELRETGVFAATNIEPITDANMRVSSLTVAVRWKHTISTRHFRALREAWGDYIHAGIVIARQTAKDLFSFIFTRGIISIDMQQLEQRLAAANITETNHYAYMSINAMRQKWTQNFAGRIVSVTHRATDVRFDVQDIYENEYETFERYLSAFLARFDRENHIGEPIADGAPDRRRLRRLQEIDPVLYNLKKYGAPRVYSTRCQREKQPVLYSEQEMRANPNAKGIVKYWNFTMQKPAHYACPDAKYPFLNFIVGVHPKGYCLPCCGKLRPTTDSKHARIEKVCLGEHTYSARKLIEPSVGYIMSFGKDLPEGRLSHLPAGYLRDTLNRAVSSAHPGASLLIFGVPQDIGAIHTLRAILGVSISDLVSAIVRGLESGVIGFDTIADGRAATYFASRRAFAGYIAGIAHGSAHFPEGTAEFMRAILTDCVRAIFDLEMVYLVTAEQAQDMRIILAKNARLDSAHVGFAVIGQDGGIHPVLAIHPDDFARNGTVASRTLIPECVTIIRQLSRDFSAHKMKVPDLALIREWTATNKSAPFEVRKLYIGLRGLCYAVLLRAQDGANAYIPIAYSGNIQKRAQEDISLDSLDDDSCADATSRAIDAINEHVSRNHLAYHKMVIEDVVQVGTHPIGFIVRAGIKMLAYFSDAPSRAATRTLSIDPRTHARMLAVARNVAVSAENSVVARINDAAARALYPYYEYDMFCVQFMARVATLRNESARARITVILESGNTIAVKREALRDLNLSRRDLATLIALLQDTKKRGSRARFADMSLEIDLEELYARIDRTTSTHELAQWIHEFMEPVTIPFAGEDARVPGVVVPCSRGGPHCARDGSGKLILRAQLDTLAEILAADLRNALKRTYIFARGATPESRTPFADFTQRASEVLLVKKYELQS